MHFTISQESFAEQLRMAARIAVERPNQPITGYVLIEAVNEDDKTPTLKFSSTNLSCFLESSTTKNLTVSTPGRVCLPASPLAQLVSSLPSSRPVTVEIDDSYTARIRCGNGYQSVIRGLAASSFPRSVTGLDTTRPYGSLLTPALKHAVSMVSFAASTKTDKPVLGAVRLRFSQNKISLAAADGLRLSLAEIECHDWRGPADFELLVEARGLEEVVGLVPDSAGVLTIGLNEGGTCLVVKDTFSHSFSMAVSLIEGKFPNVAAFMRQECQTRVILSQAEFNRATGIASYAALAGQRSASDSGFYLAAVPEEGNTPATLVVLGHGPLGQNRVDLDVTIEGEAGDIYLRPQFLMEVLRKLGGAYRQIVLEMSGRTRPLVVKPKSQTDNYCHLIWPMTMSATVTAQIEASSLLPSDQQLTEVEVSESHSSGEEKSSAGANESQIMTEPAEIVGTTETLTPAATTATVEVDELFGDVVTAESSDFLD